MNQSIQLHGVTSIKFSSVRHEASGNLGEVTVNRLQITDRNGDYVTIDCFLDEPDIKAADDNVIALSEYRR